MPSVDRAELEPALKAYTERAIHELAEACPKGPDEVIVGLRDWERANENLFMLRDRSEPLWQHCLQTRRTELHTWDEYEALAAAIRADPILSAQVETLVGTHFGASRQEVEHIADKLIWALARRANGFIFEEEAFAEEFERLVAEQEQEEFESAILGPLIGLKGDAFPMTLGEGLEVAPLTDPEIIW